MIEIYLSSPRTFELTSYFMGLQFFSSDCVKSFHPLMTTKLIFAHFSHFVPLCADCVLLRSSGADRDPTILCQLA
jgi:hypothetical protein